MVTLRRGRIKFVAFRIPTFGGVRSAVLRLGNATSKQAVALWKTLRHSTLSQQTIFRKCYDTK